METSERLNLRIIHYLLNEQTRNKNSKAFAIPILTALCNIYQFGIGRPLLVCTSPVKGIILPI